MGQVKLIFASDLAPIRNFAPIMANEPAAIYGDLLPVLGSADCRIVNLESPLDPADGFIVKSGAAFTGYPEHLASLQAGGFDVAVMANNHTFDCGEEGFRRTRRLLQDSGIGTVGAGETLAEARKPLSLFLQGVRIGIFAISEGEDRRGAADCSAGVRPWEVGRLAEEIRAARKEYDVILVSAHCGLEYQPYPSGYVYQAFQLWAEAGADVILGHHPHVPQGMAILGRTPAYFSLGNFVFYQPVPNYWRKVGYMVEMVLDASGLVSHRMIPYRITESGLRLLKGEALADFEARFAELSRPLQNGETALDAWNAVLASNGVSGFAAELEQIAGTMRATPEKGAAMLRNRITCPQHFTQWFDGMTRIMEGTLQDVPESYRRMVREFLTREVES